jgi:hypothetical protein
VERDEVRLLIEKNGWSLETRFLDSTLHCDLVRLGAGLEGTLRKAGDRDVVVFYGACHPLMDRMLQRAHATRTEGQNCAEMLLGHEEFERYLADGAYFLLEEWARRWREMMVKTFGDIRVAREIFDGDRTHLLALRTPCSGDFAEAAEAAGRLVGLPVRWKDGGLEHLERVLAEAIAHVRDGGR